MSSLVKWFFLMSVCCFVQLDCEIYEDRPKIKTSNGDLILEPAFDKSIYLLPNGPKSSIFVGEHDMLRTNIVPNNNEIQYKTSTNDDSQQMLNANSIIERLERLEIKASVMPNDMLLNITKLWRKVNTLNRKVIHLQNQLTIVARDQCEAHPCQHGGTCLSLANGYYCLCPSNWEGRDCDVDVNECRNFAGTDLGCQNGATCINRPGSYECLCRSNWYGLHCTRKEKDCSGSDYEMCGHGTCVQVSSGTGIKCICHQGWTTNDTGVACTTDVDECESSQASRCSSNPKVDCINLPGSYRCGPCPPGYEGDGHWCSDINECTSIPNGGCSPMVTCHNTIGSRICGPCPPGYQGDGTSCTWRGSCNINHGGCHPSAQCIEGLVLSGSAAQCICPEGMEGDGIGISGCYIPTSGNYTQRCENNPCVHGQCHLLRHGYTCICFKGYGGANCDAPMNYCANNPCHNGGTCRPDTSTRGFRCECTAQFSGPLCEVRSTTCGGLLDYEEGSIIYPNTNVTYGHNVQCAWVIRTIPEKVINVTFSRFNIEPHPDCSFDFLQIHDGGKSSSQLIGRFCGNNYPNGGSIVSSHNKLYFWFHSDKTVAKEGFALHWISVNPTCGGAVDASTHGHISSPGSPGPYPPNRDCYWSLTAPLNKRISLHFFALDIESHINCSYDYLAIYDGEHDTDPLLSKYCNSTQPAPVQSAGPSILIHFHSDAYGAGKGFQIAFAPVDGTPGCGGLFTRDKGEITSPSFEGTYLSNVLCEYRIRTGPETKIKISFKKFQLERSSRCLYDYLKIYDGPSSDSRLVGKFCGNTYPKTYTSSSNTLYFKFKTDHSVSAEGFRISYEAICEKILTGDSGVIKSPGYPWSYPENKVCEYIIRTSPGKAIELRFQDFDIEDNTHYNCRYDNLQIRDGPDVNSTLLGTFCGGTEHTPPVTISTHNFLYLRFSSDLSVSGTGFYANYTTIDTECGGIYKETTGLINYPNGDMMNYKNGQVCSWILIAPPGMHIKLTWNRFDIEESPKCRSDYMEVTEIDDNGENVLGKYCGARKPPDITTSANRLSLKFVSDRSVNSLGFSVSYAFLDGRFHCDGNYVKTHGFIFSPGWPKPYGPNRDCKWTITVPVGQQIQLNISNFSLERPIRGKCDSGDYLEIRNGDTDSSPLIGKYCGEFQSRRISSLANTLYLHFHSDFYLNGRGFKIEWDGTITGCGGTMTSSSGSINSPNYPSPYNDNTECFYRIVTSAGSRIRISFAEIDLERAPQCRYDYVEIYNGRDATAPSLGKYCTMTSDLVHIETTSNFAYIQFRSDYFSTNKGFLLHYNTVCNNNMTGRYGVIESPDYPNNYPLNLNCLWNIKVPKGNKLNITFSHFDIYSGYRMYQPWSRHSGRNRNIRNCEQAYLQIKELAETDYSKRLCGNTLPPAITSTSNSLNIIFKSGEYVPRTGFRLEWISDGCGGHIQKTIGSVSLDKKITSERELECEWLIETKMGMSITITFTKIYMTDSTNCTIDAIEIYNGQNEMSPLVSKICHQGVSAFQSDSNFMFIRFKKQSTLKDVHFVSQFRSTKLKCGGYIDSHSGLIHSKNYPHNYDRELDCVWFISVPSNHRIEFNLIELDLYSLYDEDCSDSIYIYEGLDMLKTNYTYRICPKSNITQYITKNNNMVVQFKTNSFGTAKGFKANFTAICGGILNAKNDGIIKSNGLVSTSNISCIWTIYAPTLDQKISLTLRHVSVPKNNEIITNRSCPSSYIRLYDGNDDKAPLINEFCGRISPPMIVSHGSALTIEFGSYSGKATGIFEAHYTSLTNACGGTLSAEKGVIASPNYPRPYPSGLDCEWTINVSPGNLIYYYIKNLDIEESERCNEDYLEIRENNSIGRLLGVYCSDQTPSTNTTMSSKIYISFHTNSKSSDSHGFELHYEYLHDNIIEADNGEIASPLYPTPYHGSGKFTWRILTSDSETISISLDHLLIPAYSETSYNKLVIYDGYDATAPLLETLNGALTEENKIIQTTSNAALILLELDDTNTGTAFHLRWAKLTEIENPGENLINCGANKTELVMPGRSTFFKTPNYPDGYANDLNCEWVYRVQPGRHLIISFVHFKLEETSNCFADSVSIYSSNNPANWKPVKENFCLSSTANEIVNSSTYMKIKFKTDSSVTNQGFIARVASKCGGIINNSSGQISVSYLDVFESRYVTTVQCDWIVKVRPGRTIKLEFVHFNITNNSDKCTTHVTLRNGESLEAPLLGNGKYCGYQNENKSGIVTSSNSLFLRYKTYTGSSSYAFTNFILRYEESNVECGSTSTLTQDRNWEVITSPNYPSVPIPYTECEWVFTGPPGEILRIEFLDRFDLHRDPYCQKEFLEIRDGLSNLSPLLGERYCGEKPVYTIKTTNNALYIKYVTQLEEPNDGFKLNVSIDVCGGTIQASAGQLTSPGYPHLQTLKPTTCEWRIIGPPRHILQIKLQDIHLPESETYCGIKLTIEENISLTNKTSVVLKTICSESDESDRNIETSTNEVIIKFIVGTASSWDLNSQYRGFRISFNSSRPVCGGNLEMSEGYLTTPSYPQNTFVRYCTWHINLPNENRRVRLELIDFDSEKQRIGLFNDNKYLTLIQSIPSDDYTPSTRIFESTGSHLTIYVWLSRSATSQRFKAKFSSDDEALCGGKLSGNTGELISPSLQQSFTCEWHFNNPVLNRDELKYKTVFITGNVNSSVTNGRCRYYDPKLIIFSDVNGKGFKFTREICGNKDVAYRIPFTGFDLRATKTKNANLYYHMQWKVQPCGGIVHVGETVVNLLNIPISYNDTLECAWIIIGEDNNRVEISTDGSFNLECNDQYIKISRGLGSDAPVIRDICKGKELESSLLLNFGYIYIEYHSKPNNNTNLSLKVKNANNQCGGYLGEYQNVFASPNYPKSYEANQECVWEIRTGVGYRVSLKFIERFTIEDTPNCTKDAVIIYDWKDNDYIEIARVCGREAPLTFNSTHNRMKIILRTDAETNLAGFKAQWGPICGGSFVASEKENILYSPGYPYHYPSLVTCDYDIIAPDSKVFIKFLEFALEGPYPDCNSDNLTIMAQSDYNYFDKVYCGTETPAIMSNYEKVSLSFKTDRYFSKKGFKLSYSIYTCGGKINDTSILTSNYEENYDDSMNCTWLIEAPTSKVVVLKFLYIDLEGLEDCSNDYVAVYEGLALDYDNRLALLCGYINSTTYIRSKSNTLLLEFISDVGVSYKGFKVEVLFSYSEGVGCGGIINLTNTNSQVLKSPLIANNVVYENFLNCEWLIVSPLDTMIKIAFTSFHISPCSDVNQTAIGYSKCDCDYVQIKDGINPNSISIGTFCGHTLPPQQISSLNAMSVLLSTDGELTSSGFEAVLSTQKSICGSSEITISETPQRIISPVDDNGNILRGLHCVYRINVNSFINRQVRLSILKFDLVPSIPDGGNINVCTRDKLIITNNNVPHNKSLGRDYIAYHESDNFYNDIYYDGSSRFPVRIELCGINEVTDYYLSGSVSVHLLTSPESDNKVHKGIVIETALVGTCGRNYTEPQGRVQTTQSIDYDHYDDNCYTLITAPENYTISVYFISILPQYWNEECYLEVFDGNTTSARRLTRIAVEYNDNVAIFSTGRYLLLYNHPHDYNTVTYDFNYVITNKGPGCGGKLHNIFGKITSPMYPKIYRQGKTCEWELETPVGSQLVLHFTDFQLGVTCDQNYLQLVDRSGDIVSTYCSETPADYTSGDNYVRIVFITTVNNGGKGWVAEFGIKK